ncbi:MULTISPECIES: pesticin C-terminus-like muramidase [unclassified Pseudomonas]|uniref:pesticin C-terminus-like muramidase n=1 Tax=unclassified Pseudomonas TaxID=196821 RepID=UPI0015A17F9B|nr:MULTISPECIES: pesticin C-terminus-like muramidase [unclassified Pseudomonas]NWC91942.1 hypothetical protein [Pseudomonas sp. IPO3779]NWD19115.1 hypothetical protein [Pseudomonas sp. IPO3778]
MANLFSQLFNLFSPDRPAPIYVPDALPLPTPKTPLLQTNDNTPQPLKNWSHPFKDKNNPLLQLTQLSKATAGYYPLGRNGLWHGGVHFDSGTAGTLEQQSSVHCLADGEVVAYRIDEHSPTTTYFVNELCIPKPFSRNFVLARHRLEAPKIAGSTEVPPSLIFYSLYMHLQDWAVYRDDVSIPRPAFWPDAETRRVKATARDVHSRFPGERGLKVYGQKRSADALVLLPPGTEVNVSGSGEFRKLNNTNGPDILKKADGSLRGYVSSEHLVPIAGDEYRVEVSFTLNVRAEASVHSQRLMQLPDGTEVTVSGEGEFRKLERVNQYVRFEALEGAREPVGDRIVVLDHPIAIKAGELIGHLGEYQDSGAEYPEKKLHLEVFSADRMEAFIEASRAWAKRLPATDNTWLKLAKGTAVVTHQERFGSTQPPSLSAASTLSDADLLVPKSLIDGLSAENKIALTATSDRKACNWYRIEGLLHDVNGTLLSGWVREEVGVTPWVNPWSWEGYDVIFNYDSPRQALASFFRAANRFSEEQLERHGRLADFSDTGPMKSRLYDIIDRDRNGKITAEELNEAMKFPAHMQSLSQLIIHYESEWRHEPHKWDALDELLGHSGSTPLLNWLAEKERIKQISWWNEVAPGVGLPAHGQVYHLHPVGLLGQFDFKNDLKIIAGKVTFDAEGNDTQGSMHYSRVVHWPGNDLSGVTLGRGYDMGNRTAVEIHTHMTNAGISDNEAKKLSLAHGLKGDAAKEFVRKNKTSIAAISMHQQISLFNIIYPDYVRRTILNYEKWTADEADRVPWVDLDPAIQDVLVDFVYQGFTAGPNPMRSGMHNSRSTLIAYIEGTPGIKMYEPGRGRANYLRSK